MCKNNQKNSKEETQKKPNILFVISTKTGGTPQTNQDLMDAIRDEYDPLLLHCDSRKITLSNGITKEILLEQVLVDSINLIDHVSSEYDEFVNFIFLISTPKSPVKKKRKETNLESLSYLNQF